MFGVSDVPHQFLFREIIAMRNNMYKSALSLFDYISLNWLITFCARMCLKS